MSRRQRKPSKANRKGVIKNAPNPDRPKRPYIKKTYENKEPKMTRTRLRNITTQECDRMFSKKDEVVDRLLENVALPVPNLGEEEPMETDEIRDPIPEKIQEVVEVVVTSGELLEKEPEEVVENVDKVAEVQSMTHEGVDITSPAEVVEEAAMDETEEIVFMKEVQKKLPVKGPRNQIVKKVLRPKSTLLIFINQVPEQTERVAPTSEKDIVEEAMEEANGQEIMISDEGKGTPAVEEPKEPNVEQVSEYIGHEVEVKTSEEVNREEEEPLEEPEQEEQFEKLEKFMNEMDSSLEHKQPEEEVKDSVEMTVSQVLEDMLQNIEIIVPLENRNERNIENVSGDPRLPPIFDIQTNIRFPAAFLDVRKISDTERDRFEINLSDVEVKSRRWTVCERRNSKNFGKERPITRLLLEIENVPNEEDVEEAHRRVQRMADSFSHWFKGDQAREGFVQVLHGIFLEQ